ncbi:hypothetical protein [Butyrivibrio sp. XPD2002]|uniref:hypothetical protein n=1 Tax=Butyrivibrio sp. XPD2002 TaxID=1280665 RepID=UPI000400FAD6|nr:hypothetical protein [Butyrivibrio sp. XPD2002]
MENNNQSNYSLDPIFERYVQPYSKEAKQQLLTSILENKDGRVVHVWKHMHLNDKEKYELCKQHGIKETIKIYCFNGRNSAAYYICTKELQRDDLCEEYRKYLIGELYHYKELIEKRDVFKRSMMKGRLSDELGLKLGISGGTVKKYNNYAAAMDIIFDTDNEFAKHILLGKVKVSHENVVELSRLRREEIRIIAKVVENDKVEKLTLQDIRNEIKWNYLRIQNSLPKAKREVEKRVPKAGTIRQMPAYDPDSEVNSLCMTIGSWVSSIERVNKTADFTKITTKARIRLSKELVSLNHMIEKIQCSLEERTG